MTGPMRNIGDLTAPPFVLRRFTVDDAAAFATAVRESASTVGRWMTWASADYPEARALEWFAVCDAAHADGSACELGIFTPDGQLVGGAGLNQFNVANGFCNLGYWVRASCQRRGAATAAARALARLAFERLGQTRVEIVVAVGNDASRGVAEKLGATRECVARNRLKLHGSPVAADVYSLVPS